MEEVIPPQIDLAKNGFTLDESDENSFKYHLDECKKYPSSYKIFSKNGKPYLEGELFTQIDLANTLEKIKQNGFDGFYSG